MVQAASAGGAWIPRPGEGNIQIGFSRKTADRVWDAKGKEVFFKNTAGVAHFHDFRYGFINGEVGLFPRVSGTFLMTYLWGFEGFKPDLEKNFGLSDAWFGAKFRIQDGRWPMALKTNVRTPFFYDQEGPYVRHLYNREPYRLPGGRVVQDTTFQVINNPEWRGLLKHDVTLAYVVSHSFTRFRGWMSFDAGYTWREGAPADEIPLNGEMGYALPWKSHVVYAKAGLTMVKSLGNNSTPDSNDRFNFPPGSAYDFNDASMLRGSLSLIWAFYGGRWNAEAGYGQWLWGRGAREYKEPFFTIGHSW
jgi:hypothetical protein